MDEQLTHVYVIVYSRNGEKVEILSGREKAVHAKANKELDSRLLKKGNKTLPEIFSLIENKKVLLDSSGGNNKFKIGRNFSGVLLIGRTALPGGKIEDLENPENAAIRELEEEFGLKADPSALQILTKMSPTERRREVYYTLDLANLSKDPKSIVERFVPTDEKRSLELLTVDTFIQNLESPDEADKEYIRGEMREFSNSFCCRLEKITERKISDAGKEKLARELFDYEIKRKSSQPDAAREFQKKYCSPHSIKDNIRNTLMPPAVISPLAQELCQKQQEKTPSTETRFGK